MLFVSTLPEASSIFVENWRIKNHRKHLYVFQNFNVAILAAVIRDGITERTLQQIK